MKFGYDASYTLPINSPKYLDPSYKTDLDFLDCFGMEKTEENMVR